MEAAGTEFDKSSVFDVMRQWLDLPEPMPRLKATIPDQHVSYDALLVLYHTPCGATYSLFNKKVH